MSSYYFQQPIIQTGNVVIASTTEDFSTARFYSATMDASSHTVFYYNSAGQKPKMYISSRNLTDFLAACPSDRIFKVSVNKLNTASYATSQSTLLSIDNVTGGFFNAGTGSQFYYDNGGAKPDLYIVDETVAQIEAELVVIDPDTSFQLANGSVTVPSLAFANDTDMGFYRVGDGQMGLTVEGVLQETFAAGAITFAKEIDQTISTTTTTTAATAGGAITLTSGKGATSGAGGALTEAAGQGGLTGAGGNASLTSGAGGATSGASGTVTVASGVSTSGNTGTATVSSGNATSGTSGVVTLSSGTGTTATGNVVVGSGAATTLSGNVSISSGTAITTGTATLSSGNATTTSGNVIISAGTASTTGGTVAISTGNMSAGTSAAISIVSGSGTTGTGQINITTGNGSAGTSGDIVLNTGTSTGVKGHVKIGGGMIQNHTPVAINSNATATAAQVATGYITSTSAAQTTITLPTGTLLGTELGATQGTIHNLWIDNTAGASNVIIAVAVNGILSAAAAANGASQGLLTIPNGVTGQGCFQLMFSSATAYTFTRIA